MQTGELLTGKPQSVYFNECNFNIFACKQKPNKS